MREEKKKVGAGVGVILIRSGKLEWGETFEEGAIREVEEETGILIKDPRLTCSALFLKNRVIIAFT